MSTPRSRLSQLVAGATSAVVLATAIAACGGGSSGSSTGNLSTALSYLPGDARSSYVLTFADWGQVEHDVGVKPSVLTSSKAISALIRPMTHEGDLPAGEADYDLGIPDPHRLWAARDVTWDASVEALGRSAPPLSMTGLQPDFDMAAIGTRLAGCGFAPKKLGGITVYEGSLSNLDRCAGPFGNQIPTATNYGLDTTTHTVLMSASPDVIAAALSAHTANRTSAPVDALLKQLQGQPAIGLGVGPAFCAQVSDPATLAGPNATPQQIEATRKEYPPAKPYLAFGFGLTMTSRAETGRIVFTYASTTAAKAAVGDRQSRLQTGRSLVAHLPYSQLFHAAPGTVSGSNVVFPVSQPNGRPLELTQMFNRFDLGFAICG